MSGTSAVDWDQWLRRWDAQQTVYLPDRESRFDAMLDLAEMLWARGRLEEVRGLEEHVVAARRQALGEGHGDTLKALGKLATTIGALGDVNAASLWLRPATTVGIAVAVYFALIGPIFLYVAIRPSGGTWSDIGRVYAAPMFASISMRSATMRPTPSSASAAV